MQGRPLMQRRSRMLTLRSQGVKITQIVQDLAKEHGLHEQSLWKDWRNRARWAKDVVRTEDPTLIEEMIQGLRQVIPNAWYEYKTNPNPSVKLGSLKLVKDTYIDIIEILQSTGRMERMPDVKQIMLGWLQDDSKNSDHPVQTP